MQKRTADEIEAFTKKVLKSMSTRKNGFSLGEVGQCVGLGTYDGPRGPVLTNKKNAYHLRLSLNALRDQGRVTVEGERSKARYIKVKKATGKKKKKAA